MLVNFCTGLKSIPRKQSQKSFNSWYSVKNRINLKNFLTIDESDKVELIGLTFDKEQNFSKHFDKLWHNASCKLHVLRRIRKYLSLEKAKILGNVFIDCQFNYAPLIWMLYRKGWYLKIKKNHHKTLNVIYQSNKTYKEVLELSETVSIHQRHLRFLVTEVYKSTSFLNPKFICSLFTHKEIPYNLRSSAFITSCKIDILQNWISALQGSLIWNNLPKYIKSSRWVCEFKSNRKNFRDMDSGYLICRTWI